MVLDEQQTMIRDTARQFARQRLLPHAARCDRVSHFPMEEIREMGRLAAYEAALSYARERVVCGKKILDRQTVGFRIAAMATRIETARQMVLHAAALTVAGLPSQLEACMAKLVASEAAEWVCSGAIQTFGGYGYLTDFPGRAFSGAFCGGTGRDFAVAFRAALLLFDHPEQRGDRYRTQRRDRDVVDLPQHLMQGAALVLVNGRRIFGVTADLLEQFDHVEQRHSLWISREAIAPTGAAHRFHQSRAHQTSQHFGQVIERNIVFRGDFSSRNLLIGVARELQYRI